MNHQLTQTLIKNNVILPFGLINSPEYSVLLSIYDAEKGEVGLMDFIINSIKDLLKYYPFMISDCNSDSEDYTSPEEPYYVNDYNDTPTEENEEVINTEYNE